MVAERDESASIEKIPIVSRIIVAWTLWVVAATQWVEGGRLVWGAVLLAVVSTSMLFVRRRHDQGHAIWGGLFILDAVGVGAASGFLTSLFLALGLFGNELAAQALLGGWAIGLVVFLVHLRVLR